MEEKVLHYFAIFAIINELLIIKNCRISPTYCLMQARGRPAIVIARRAESCLLQATIVRCERHWFPVL